MNCLTTRRAIKYGLIAAVAVAAYGLEVKVQKASGFDSSIPGLSVSVDVSKATAACGQSFNCSGGGGKCGQSFNCAGQ